MAGISSMLNNVLLKRKMNGKLLDYRALQPICAALEVHSWKTALQLCTKLSRKQPNLYIVYALKSIALAGTHRPVDSQSLRDILNSLEYVKSHANGAGLADPDVLLVFGWVLTSIGQSDEIMSMLTKATELHPDNEQVLVEAFLHYVRVAERRAAQQISLRLAKIGTADKYAWWSVMSILLQVRDPTTSDARLLLSLAERQIAAHFDQVRVARGISHTSESTAGTTRGNAEAKGKAKAQEKASDGVDQTLESTCHFESADEFHLVARFLELNALHAPSVPLATALSLPSFTSSEGMTARQALLAHFGSKEGDNWCETSLGLELWRRKIELRHGSPAGGEWIKCWDRLNASLQKGDTNWHTMLYLIRCAFACVDQSSDAFISEGAIVPPPSSSAETTSERTSALELVKRSHDLVRGLADDSEKGRLERGFLLAVLEIALESRRRNLIDAQPLLPLVEEYFDRFGSKMCCFDDLAPHLAILDDNEAASLHEKLRVEISQAGDLSLKQVFRIINASKIARHLSPSSDATTQNAIAEADLQRYFETLPIGKELPPTDLQPADDFALLAAQALVSAGDVSGDRSYFERALLVLEYGLQRSRHKYQMRILAINISKLLGAPSIALAHYDVLNPKAIQNDTLSHLVLNRAATFAATGSPSASARDLLTTAASSSSWYRFGEHEAAEMVVRVFNYHNYSKIEDFTDFQERLSWSLNKFMVQLETVRIRLIRRELDSDRVSEAKTQLEFIVRHRDVALFDNRDFDTLPNLQARSQPGIWNQTAIGPKTTVDWLRAFVTIYGNMLRLESLDADGDKLVTDDLTPSEASLLKFSSAVRVALTAPLDDVNAEQDALDFFKEQTTSLTEALEDTSKLPWEILHIAQISLEGFLLLELAIEHRTAEITASKPTDHAKLVKKLKGFRNAARDLTRTIGSKTIAHGKKVAKERARTITAVASLKQYPQIDDDYVTNFAHALVESRKVTVEALGQALHRATQK